MKRLSTFVGLAVCLALFAPGLRAQTTGGITGHILDESGAMLPGVIIEAKGPALQGVRAARTGSTGSYHLTLLPPGAYTVTFTMEGYAPLSRANVTVALGKEATLDVTLQRTVREEISVVADAPVIDTGTTTIGGNLSDLTIESLPSGRNYSAVVQVVPGVSTDANADNSDPERATVTVYGSSGSENSWFIDGVNTTGVEYGQQGKSLPSEFIQEIEVKTGGYEAEYGRSTGGIINVITKSGGNEFHGSVFGYRDSDALQRSALTVVSPNGTVTGFTRNDYGADFGGYFVKDRLWFYAAYDQLGYTFKNSLNVRDNSGNPTGAQVNSQTDLSRDLGSAKLTWNITSNHSLVGTYFQDPGDTSGAINDSTHTLNGDPDTYLGTLSTGGHDGALRYQGIFANNWVLAVQAAQHREENTVGPASAAGDAVQFRDADLNYFQTGGFGLIQTKDFKRDLFSASVAGFLGRHSVKFGAEYEKQEADVTKRMSGGQQVDRFINPNTLSPEPYIYRHAYWTTPDATVANAPLSQLSASPQHKNTTIYAQDEWEITPRWTVNYGLRWDRQQIVDASGAQQIDLTGDFAPRLGFVWDPTGEHKSKVFGSYGRYYEQLPMDLVIRSFSYERQPRIVNYSPTGITPDAGAEADFGTSSAILGGFTEPSDPNLEGQYLNEFLAGAEWEVLPHTAFGVKGIYRSYGQVIEDFLCKDDGTYCIGNPGQGIMDRVFTLDYSRTKAAPKAERTYRGIQLDLTKRLSHNWQGIVSYVYSKLDGNYDGEFAPYTNVGPDPNISAAYDYYDFFTNGSDLSQITNHGTLSNDRRHQLKVSGSWITPCNLTIGFSGYARSGTPLTRYGYSDAYGRYEFFLTPRGREGSTPWTWEADLHFGYPIAVGSKVNINLLLDVFNILNAQRPVLLDQRYGFQESDNALSKPANPDYLQPLVRTAPTAARVGLRVSF